MDLAALPDTDIPLPAREMPRQRWETLCWFWSEICRRVPFQESPSLESGILLVGVELHLTSILHQRLEQMGLPSLIEEQFGLPFGMLTQSRFYGELLVHLLAILLWDQLQQRPSRIIPVGSVPPIPKA